MHSGTISAGSVVRLCDGREGPLRAGGDEDSGGVVRWRVVEEDGFREEVAVLTVIGPTDRFVCTVGADPAGRTSLTLFSFAI